MAQDARGSHIDRGEPFQTRTAKKVQCYHRHHAKALCWPSRLYLSWVATDFGDSRHPISQVLATLVNRHHIWLHEILSHLNLATCAMVRS